MKIHYQLFAVTARLVSRLPFPVLYGLSDIASALLYHLIRYRKKVVMSNLHNAFPEKTEREIKKIARQFYHHLADLILEVIKTRGMSQADFRNRFSWKNFEAIQSYIDNKQSFIIAMGHCGNWEWFGVFFSTFPELNPYGVVKPLSDKFFEDYMNSLRLKFAAGRLIDFRKAFREMVRMRNDFCITAIIGDQTPTKNEIHYWTRFLNQETPVYLGTEKIAKSLNQPVVFMNLYRFKRGYYQIEFTPVTDKPTETAEFEITETHVRLLEDAIRKRPYNWLWSHRRWKHKKEQ